MTSGRSQGHVTRHFDDQASWWDHSYDDDSLQARILRRRQQVRLPGSTRSSAVQGRGCSRSAAVAWR
jgi:hypothetical protein